MWENAKSSYKNRKFKIASTKWNDKFKLPVASYSVLHILF